MKSPLTICNDAAALRLALGSGCKRPAEAAKPPAKPPPEVLVSMPTTAEITDYEDFTGRTVAVKTIELRARVTGYLDKINFEDGC